jgi:hypothetical protein
VILTSNIYGPIRPWSQTYSTSTMFVMRLITRSMTKWIKQHNKNKRFSNPLLFLCVWIGHWFKFSKRFGVKNLVKVTIFERVFKSLMRNTNVLTLTYLIYKVTCLCMHACVRLWPLDAEKSDGKKIRRP